MRYWRKIITIKAVDSPNVILGLAQEAAGRQPTNATVVPGVLSYEDYKKRRATWDVIRQCIGLDAEFYEGEEVKMFPPLWLNRAATLAKLYQLQGRQRRAKAIGVDPGEGVEDTSWAVVDEIGLIHLLSLKTLDTSVIIGHTLNLMRQFKVPAEYVCFDRGGGGKQHADTLRAQGYPVRTVSFGEPLLMPIQYHDTNVKDRVVNRDERYAYFNRRAEMYGTLRMLIDPASKGFALPACYTRLFQELRPIPLSYDQEGRLYLLPKNRKDPKGTTPTLIELIGHSPNDADALVVAIHAMTHKPLRASAGVVNV